MDYTNGNVSEDMEDAQEYYLAVDADVNGDFHCLDDPENLERYMDAVQDPNTRNFVVDFSDETAWTGFDIGADQLSELVATERPDALNTRWINVWYPYQHRELLEVLAKRYDFSPRLLALMCSNPRQTQSSPPRSNLTKQVGRKAAWGRKRVTFDIQETDAEKAEEALDELAEHSSIASKSSTVRSNLYKIASDIWHYSSIDFGRNYTCLGYNTLYGTKTTPATVESDTGRSNLPECIRVWTWLVICQDNTVITIHEDPFPYAMNHYYTSFQRRILMETRRNLVNVFRSLSAVTDAPFLTQNPLTLLPIRMRIGDSPEESAHRDSDAPGLLFYYLFENWHNSYTLVTRKESRYGVELSEIRDAMFEQPQLEHIDRLDTIGKELGVLRRHYGSYDRLIDRVLEPQSCTAASLQNSQVVGSDDSASLSTIRPRVSGVVVREKESMLGVSLSSASRVRFRRLRDLIDLYALSEVEEYIKQKESMVSMASRILLPPTTPRDDEREPVLIFPIDI
jgi:hypothetical protein